MDSCKQIVDLLNAICTSLNSREPADTHIIQLQHHLSTYKTTYPAKDSARDTFTQNLVEEIQKQVTPVEECAKIDVVWDLDDCLIKSS